MFVIRNSHRYITLFSELREGFDFITWQSILQQAIILKIRIRFQI